jgi:hypothetical protein
MAGGYSEPSTSQPLTAGRTPEKQIHQPGRGNEESHRADFTCAARSVSGLPWHGRWHPAVGAKRGPDEEPIKLTALMEWATPTLTKIECTEELRRLYRCEMMEDANEEHLRDGDANAPIPARDAQSHTKPRLVVDVAYAHLHPERS